MGKKINRMVKRLNRGPYQLNSLQMPINPKHAPDHIFHRQEVNGSKNDQHALNLNNQELGDNSIRIGKKDLEEKIEMHLSKLQILADLSMSQIGHDTEMDWESTY